MLLDLLNLLASLLLLVGNVCVRKRCQSYGQQNIVNKHFIQKFNASI